MADRQRLQHTDIYVSSLYFLVRQQTGYPYNMFKTT